MAADLGDLNAFMAVARAGGFRNGARASGRSASSVSEAVRRLEAGLGVRLLNRTTRSVAPTEAGARLLERLGPALGEVEAALDVVNGFRDRPAGTLRLNVPVSAARLVLPAIVPAFLAAYPDINLDVIAEDGFVDVLAAGCDAGIRYDERLEQDMIAVPIGPREQRYATAASPAYLDRRGRPGHPRELPGHACLRGRFASGAMILWEFERDGEIVRVEPSGPLIVRVGAATDLAVDAAVGGTGIIQLFEDWLRPHLDGGTLSLCWSLGGRASPVRFSTTQVVATFPRPCAPSWISSATFDRKLDTRQPVRTSGRALGPPAILVRRDGLDRPFAPGPTP